MGLGTRELERQMPEETRSATVGAQPGTGRGEVLRVLHCRAPQTFGGPDRQILALMERAAQVGIQQQYLVIGRRGQGAGRNVVDKARERGLSASLVVSQGRMDPRPLWSLWRTAREGKMDIICTHGYLPDFLGRVVGRLSGCGLVAVSRGFTARARSIRAYEWADRRVLRSFDHVVTVSEALRQQLIRCGLSPARVTAIHNAVGEIEPLPRAQARAALGMSPEAFVVGCVGRLSPEKGHRIILDATARLVGRGITAKTVICGDGPEMPALVAQRRRLGLEDAVLLPGWRTDVDQILSAFDVFVLPSFTEGMPNALLEAQAAGVPAVASAVGGVPELISDGETGILAPAGDSEALAAAVGKLYRDADLAHSLAAAGRARVAERFSRAAQAERYRRVFEAVRARRPRPRSLANSPGKHS